MPHRLIVKCIIVTGLASLALVTSAAAALDPPPIGSGNTATADPPVARPSTAPCVVPLFDHLTFADYSPRSFSYQPPAGCPGPWAKVVFQADFAVSAGRQYDRTGNIWIGGANVYFGTTMEPSRAVARSWHVERDLTDYSPLFATAQPGEADLGNLVNATYTGIITGSASLSFYPLEPHARPARAADVVLPLSAGPSGGVVNLDTGTSTLARSFTLPTNVERAYLDVIAQSQAGDEFWFTCVPDDVAGPLQSCGATGFRETEIAVDGKPAGVAPVYPWLYTGAIDPYLWRPIPSVETLQFTPYRVDLTPFAGLLSDGKPHEVALRVFNAHGYFATTASLLLYLDHGSTQVSGEVTLDTLAAEPSPVVKTDLTTAADGAVSGSVGVTSTRLFTIAGFVKTSHGKVHTEVVQLVHFSNQQHFDVSAASYVQNIDQSTSITSLTRTREHGRERLATRHQEWPLSLDYAYLGNADGSAAQTTTVRQQYESVDAVSQDGRLLSFGIVSNVIAPTDTLLFDASGALTGTRDQTSTQEYFAADSRDGCYSRTVSAENGLVTTVSDGDACGFLAP